MATAYRLREPAWPHAHPPARRHSRAPPVVPPQINWQVNVLQRQPSRTEAQRREDQIRIDEAIAAREQAEEERLMLLDSIQTAEQHRREQLHGGLYRKSSVAPSSSSSLRKRSGSHSEQANRPSGPTIGLVSPPNDQHATPQTAAPSSTESPPVVSNNIHSHSTSPSADLNAAQELRNYSSLFTRSLKCSQCDNNMVVHPMVDASLSRQLHLTCGRCRITHCRGCARPVDCAPNCDVVRSPCCLRNCCRKGRAIAIFEILGHFDKTYAVASESLSKSDIWPVPKAERHDFLKLVTSNGDPRFSKRFNDSLRDTLEAIQFWLPLDKRIHDSVRLVLSTSFLLEVLRAYLKDSTKSRINWVIYGELYTEILNVLKLLSRQPCHRDLIMGQQLPVIQRSSGLQAWVWNDEHSEWSAEIRPSRKSLYSVADSKDARADFSKLRERLRNPESRDFISQFSMDLQHLLCLNVLP